MIDEKLVSKKLLLVPLFMLVTVFVFLMGYRMIVAKAPLDITFPMFISSVSFMLIVSLFNVVPFFILRLVHSKVVCHVVIPCNRSFYVAFVIGILLMLIVIGDLLVSFFLRKPGIQFIPLVFIFLPLFIFFAIIIGYFISLMTEFILFKHKKRLSKRVGACRVCR